MKQLRLLGVALLMAGNAFGQTIEFTTDEGYTDGPLSRQNSWRAVHAVFGVSNSGGGGQVRAEVGRDLLMKRAIFPAIMAEGKPAYSAKVSFALEGVGADQFEKMVPIMAIELDAADGDFEFDGFRMMLTRLPNGNNYRLSVISSEANQFVAGPVIAESKLGLDGSSRTSDVLTLTMTIRRGAAPGNWAIEGALEAAEQGLIATLSATDRLSSELFFKGEVDVAVNTVEAGAGGIGSIVIESVGYGVE